ncbi:hypothetical protein K875_00006 [Mycobacterium [tuberculosis] TKK-01-0051]|uniref:Rieske domain-containing protein n=1 Tax=Mycobacterium [tuberculosis] TKK-01-0051 TaxID=1324261 RepID=A0A051UL33_9MYCO|nr:Rieske 2Fe-2S domain-containing protein [Mycobacterium colombiense]KBZ69291.1 hypothetical protein K875_00006 [Mycobacterium [tuberculosis] TKK-01-0051]
MLVRVGDGVYDISNLCTHAEVWLDSGMPHPKTLEIEYPLHEEKFDLRTGNQTALPCIEPVKKYEVVIDNSEVFIDFTEDH